MLCCCLILLKIAYWHLFEFRIDVTRIVNVAIDIVSMLTILSASKDDVSSDISIFTVVAIVEQRFIFDVTHIACVAAIVKSVLTVINAIQNVNAISTMFVVSNPPSTVVDARTSVVVCIQSVVTIIDDLVMIVNVSYNVVVVDIITEIMKKKY